MKSQKIAALIVPGILILVSCRGLTETALPTQPVVTITATTPAATATAEPTSIPVGPEALAGLIISSPVLGTPHEVPGMHPSEKITPSGLGIVNAEGELIPFSDAGLFRGYSPSGVQIVYQHGFRDETTDHIDSLYIYNAMTGETTEILDSLPEEGGKGIVAWLQDERKFIYYNDYEEILFEAYGYFDPIQLLLADVATGRTTHLVDGYQFDVSPDQAQIAYTTGEILRAKKGQKPQDTFGCFQPRMYDLASSSSRAFDLGGLDEKPACAGYPKWSPDGKKIAWIGYFEDDTFRPIVFDLPDRAGRIYPALQERPRSSLMPTFWSFGETDSGIYAPPDWIDNTTFWTPSYEVNTETNKTTTPRDIDTPDRPGRDKFIRSPAGSFLVSLDDNRDAIVLSDANKKLLASFPVAELYKGPKLEILTSPFVLPGVNELGGWSPFIPPAEAEK